MAATSIPTRGFHPRRGRIVLVALLAVAFVLGTMWLDGGVGIVPAALWQVGPHTAWWNAPWRMFCNALPGLLLAFTLLAWTRRAGWSFAVAFGVQGLVYGVNALKVQNLAIPLMPADFHMVGQLGHGGGELLAAYLPHPWLLVGAVVLALALLVAWFRLEPPLFAARPGWRRALPGAVLGVALLTLLAGVPVWRGVYSRNVLGMQPWSPLTTRNHDGLIGSLMLFHLQYASQHRTANPRRALALMARYQKQVAAMQTPPPGDGDKPDIVVILSESFFDPTIMNGWPAGTDLTPNLHRLERHATWGRLHVPTFGGGTIRTEFEVLTGLSLRYFPDVQFPYLQINQKRIPGIVRVLDHAGYTTLAVHGNDPGFWNRRKAFAELGFSRFVSIGDFPKDDAVFDGKYMSDKSFTDELLRQLPDSGPPRFVLGISIEAHGPYDKSAVLDPAARDAIRVPPDVTDPDARREVQNYIYHMQHADAQLGRLVDTLAKRKRRTLVLFFGDHLPALVDAFNETGFRNGQGFLTQAVPYILIDTAHLEASHQQDAAAWELPGMLLHQAGIGADQYFALTRLVAPDLAALTRAPDAPVPPEDAEQTRLDAGMRSVAELRLSNKLYKLWPEAAAMASGTAPQPTVQGVRAASIP